MPREAWVKYLTEYFAKSDIAQIIDGSTKSGYQSVQLLSASNKVMLWLEYGLHTYLHCHEFHVKLYDSDSSPVFISKVLSTIIVAWVSPSLRWPSLAKDAQIKIQAQIIKEMGMKPSERVSWYPVWVIDAYKVVYGLYNNRISKKIEKSVKELKLCLHELHNYGLEKNDITKIWDEVVIEGVLKS